MLNILRLAIGYVAMFPFFLCFRILSLFIGKSKSALTIGTILTKVAGIFVGTGIPGIADKNLFLFFKSKIVHNFKMFWLLYDIEVKSESTGHVEFKILNCPFASALKSFGVGELCKFACAGDFVIANQNKSKWKFSRTHSHGTDGICCNHTYYSLDFDNKQNEKDVPRQEEKWESIKDQEGGQT